MKQIKNNYFYNLPYIISKYIYNFENFSFLLSGWFFHFQFFPFGPKLNRIIQRYNFDAVVFQLDRSVRKFGGEERWVPKKNPLPLNVACPALNASTLSGFAIVFLPLCFPFFLLPISIFYMNWFGNSLGSSGSSIATVLQRRSFG